jgi:hypothetical protein
MVVETSAQSINGNIGSYGKGGGNVSLSYNNERVFPAGPY